MSNTTSPLDFSQLTPSQLEKSRLAQLKGKRRSNVGVWSSPETNSLIRYIAQQRRKTPPTTPQISLVWWRFLRSQVLFERLSMMPKHSGQTQQWRTTPTPKDLSSHVA